MQPRLTITTVFLCAFSGTLAISTGNSKAANLTPDGNFEAQKPGGSPITAPWTFTSGIGNAGSASSQSPFVNVFANNGIGAHTLAAADTANPYFVGSASSVTPANATGHLYLNVDFRNNTNDAGAYSIVVTADTPAWSRRSVGLYISNNSLFDDSGAELTNLFVGDWNTLQLDLNLTTNSYSGSIMAANPGGGGHQAPIADHPFATEDVIAQIYSDNISDGRAGTAPDHDIDNFVLSTTPFVAAPEPVALAPIIFIGAAAVGRRRGRRHRLGK